MNKPGTVQHTNHDIRADTALGQPGQVIPEQVIAAHAVAPGPGRRDRRGQSIAVGCGERFAADEWCPCETFSDLRLGFLLELVAIASDGPVVALGCAVAPGDLKHRRGVIAIEARALRDAA